jgi:hypothetical protein
MWLSFVASHVVHAMYPVLASFLVDYAIIA